MNKNVIMILIALLAVVAIGVWVQYSIVKALKGEGSSDIEKLTNPQPTDSTTTTKSTSKSGASSTATKSDEGTGKKATIAPVHKK